MINLVKISEYLLLCDLCKSAGTAKTFNTEDEAREHLAEEHGILDFFSLVPVLGEPEKVEDDDGEEEDGESSEEVEEKVVEKPAGKEEHEGVTAPPPLPKKYARAKILSET